MTWHALVTNPLVRGAVAGLVSAAAVDYRAFLTWKSFHDLATYSWSTALFRWAQGAVAGAATAGGFWAIS